MTASRLARLLHPRSIAVIGGRDAEGVVRQCDRMGYRGAIHPVNPGRAEIAGRTCVASVAALPAAPDAAFVAVRREASIETVAELAARGCGGAVCYASGFGEVGAAGVELQARLVEAAGDMPILGPNCYGLINYLDGALLWPDQHGGRREERGVAILTQSGNLAITLTMQRRALPIAYVASLGNQAQIDMAACLEALVDEPRVTAVGLHIEGLRDAARFEAAALRALDRRLPIVVLKAGRSETGARLALSHTASLAGGDAVFEAFLNRLGIARVHALPDFVETLKLLHAVGPLAGREIAAMSCSGGEAALIADAAEGRRLRFRPLDEARRASVAATLSGLETVSNPLDYHTFIWGDGPRLQATFAAMLDDGFDLTLLLSDLPRADRCDDRDWQVTLEALAAARAGRPAAVVATLPECLSEDDGQALVAQGIAPLQGIGEALTAVEAAADIGAAQARPPPPPLPHLPAAAPPAGEVRSLSEWSAKQALAAAGLPVPRGRLAGDAEAAVAAAREIGFPVVLKAVGANLLHKSEQGAVRLGLRDADSVAAAFASLSDLGDAVLVEEMVEDGVAELILGVVRDPQFGPVLTLGAGGILVELLGDRRLLLPPVDAETALQAVTELRAYPLLTGHRGRPAGDLAALGAAVAALSRFVGAQAERLFEVEINPLILRPEGRGAVAVDALLRVYEGEGQ